MRKSLARLQPSRAPRCVLTLLVGLSASLAHAQVFVTDQAAITNNKAGFAAQLAKTASEYAKQVEQYTTQLQQYETQLNQYREIMTSIEGLATGGIKLTSGRLDPIGDATNLINQACPGANGGGVLGAMTSIVTSAFDKSIKTTQQNICAQIVLAQVDKYNKTVKVVNDTQQFGSQLQQLTSNLVKMDSQGDSERNAANAAYQNSQIASEMVDWQAQMKKDDAIIETLRQQQGILAKVALNGSNTTLGNIVQAAAFAKAFDD